MDRQKRLVIFDLDGTLVDTAAEIAGATNDFLARYGWPALPSETVRNWIGRGTRTLLVEAIANATGRTHAEIRAADDFPAFVDAFDADYDAHCGTTSVPYPHMREAVTGLQAAGIRTAIVTNKEARYTRRVLEAHDLATLFEPVICGDTLDTRKPDPAGVLSCLEATGTVASDCLFVGDSIIDAQTARNAGIPVWLLPHGYNMGLPLAEAQADRIVADFAEIAAELLRPVAGHAAGAGVDRDA